MKYTPEVFEKEIQENHRIFQERFNIYKDKGLDSFKNREFILNKTGSLKEKVLDIGSGRGITVLALTGAGYNVTTVDNNEEMLKTTALNLAYEDLLRRADIYEMDAYALEFSDNSFNTIFMVEVLHHLEDVERILSEAGRVLSKGGKIILADFNERGKEIIDEVHASEGRKHEGSFSGKGQAKKWLSANGYTLEEYDDTYHWVFVAVKK